MPTAADVFAERSRQEHAEQERLSTHLSGFGLAVISSLGGGWSMTAENNGHRSAPSFLLRGPDGVILRLKHEYGNDNLIRAITVNDVDLMAEMQTYNARPRPSIREAIAWGHGEQGVAQMVKALTEELLPVHRADLGGVRGRIAAARAAKRQTEDNAGALLGVLGGGMRPIAGQAEVALTWNGGDRGGKASLRVHPEHVRITSADIPMDKFLRIAAILAED